MLPDAADEVRMDDAVAFASIPEGQRGKLLVEHEDGADRMISPYVFRTSGESDFIEGQGVEEEEPDPSAKMRTRQADISEGIASDGGALIDGISATDITTHSAERLRRAPSNGIRAIGRDIAKEDAALLKALGES